MRRRNKKSRVFAIALSAFLITTMLPSGVLAAEQVSAPDTAITEAIAEAKAYAALTQEIGKVSVYAQVCGGSVDAEEEDIMSTEGESTSEQDTVGGSAEDTEGGTAGDSVADTDTIGGSAEDTSGATDGGSDADETQEVSEAAEESASGEDELETGTASSSAKMSSVEAEEDDTAAAAEDGSSDDGVAAAADGDTVCTLSYTTTSDGVESTVTGKYASVEAAVEAMEEDSIAEGTITLGANSTEAETIVIGSSSDHETEVTLDLNGYILTGSGDGSVVLVYAILNVCDSSDYSGTVAFTTGTVTDEQTGEESTVTVIDEENSGGIITGGIGSEDTTEASDSEGDAEKNLYGGGIYVENGGSLTMTGGAVYGNTADYGAGICAESNASCALSDMTIQGNEADHNGGGLYVKSGYAVSVSGVTIDSNEANYGGGLYADSTTVENLQISGCTISNNIATTGGGGICYNSSYNTLPYTSADTSDEDSTDTDSSDEDSSDNVISDNYAAAGGGIYASGSIITINSGTISGNYATDAKNDGYSNTLCGGGIYVNGNTLTVNGGTISGNCAQATYTGETSSDISSSGGGIYVYSGTLSVTGGSITGNSAQAADKVTSTDQGGGIAAANSSTVEISGGTIASNTADTYGGGICVANTAALSVTGGTIGGTAATDANTSASGGGVAALNSSTVNLSKDACIQYNTASSLGGGIYLYNSGTSLTVTGGTIAYNTASNNGGGIYVDQSTATLSGGTITENTANNSNGGGGGIYIGNGSSGTLYVTDDAVISDNTAVNNGGGVYVLGATAYISGGTIGGTSSSEGNTASNNGGGIYSTGTVNVTGGTISYNTASSSSYGGGGIASYGGTVAVSGGSILYNEATAKNGGGIIAYNGASVTITGDAAITSNTAYNNGGGIYITDSETSLTISGGTIGGASSSAKNSAKKGAGICVDNGTFSMSDGTISANAASQYGGGIYISSDLQEGSTITGGTIGGSDSDGGNTAVLGGGIYINSNDELTLAGGTIAYNTASSSSAGGGGVYVTGTSSDAGKFTMTSGTIKANSAFSGGGVYVADEYSTFDMDGGTVSDMTVYGNGGGVYLAGGTFAMSGGSLSGLTAGYLQNGTAYTYEDDSDGDTAAFTYVSDVNGTPTTAHTYGNGGGVYGAAGSTVTISATAVIGGATVTSSTTTDSEGNEDTQETTTSNGNYAQQGGGIYLTGACSLTMTGGEISYNTCYELGGGVAIEDGAGATFTMSGGTISNNAAIGDPTDITAWGGGVYIEGSGDSEDSTASFTMTGGTISDNKAYITVATSVISEADEESNSSSSTNDYTINFDYAGGYGGGICAKQYVTCSISNTDADVSITGNSASHRGGGIFAYKSTGMTISNATIASNNTAIMDGSKYTDDYTYIDGGTEGTVYRYANGEGGGIFVNSASSFTMSGCTISGNYGDHYGGGVYLKSLSGTGTITGCTFTGNYLSSDTTSTYDYYSKGDTDGDGDLDSDDGNKTTANEGYGGGLVLNDTSSTLTITGTTFTGNYVSCHSGAKGGAIANKATIAVDGTSSFTNNYVTIPDSTVSGSGDIQGGAIYNGASMKVTGTGDSDTIAFTENTASPGDGSGSGGAIMNQSSDASLSLKYVTFTSNESDQKGGAICNQFGSAGLESCTITKSESSQGAAIVVQSGKTDAANENAASLTLKSTTLSANTATSYGGGIAARDGASSITICSSTIQSNSAPLGAGIYDAYDKDKGAGTIYGSAYEITDSSITENAASNIGGGLYVSGSTITLNASTIEKNTAANYGGGIFAIGNANTDSSAITITADESSSVSENAATYGAGICTAIFTYTTTDSDGSSSTYNYSTDVTLSGLSISGNEATYGGGLYLYDETNDADATNTVYLYGCDVQHNTALIGGGAYLTDSILVTEDSTGTYTEDSVLANNTAEELSSSSAEVSASAADTDTASASVDTASVTASAQAADLYADAASSIDVSGINNAATEYEADELDQLITGWYWDKAEDEDEGTERYAAMTVKDEETEFASSEGYILIAAYDPGEDDEIVIDYGLAVDIDFLDNESLTSDTSYQLSVAILNSSEDETETETEAEGSTVYTGTYTPASNDAAASYGENTEEDATTSFAGTYGTFAVSYNSDTNLPYLTYELTEALSAKESLTYQFTISRDSDSDGTYETVQAGQGSIMIMPATQIYYEEDFGQTTTETTVTDEEGNETTQTSTQTGLIEYSSGSNSGTWSTVYQKVTENMKGSEEDETTETTETSEEDGTTETTETSEEDGTTETTETSETDGTSETTKEVSGDITEGDTNFLEDDLQSYTQETGVVGDSDDSIYGSDPAYKDSEYSTTLYDSELHSEKADVGSKPAAFRYYFTGTGTTIYGRTSENAAYISVKLTYVGDESVTYTSTEGTKSTLTKNAVADTWYIDTRNVADTSNTTDSAIYEDDGDATLYNIPVYDITDLPYGDWKVYVYVYVSGTSVDYVYKTTTVYPTDYYLRWSTSDDDGNFKSYVYTQIYTDGISLYYQSTDDDNASSWGLVTSTSVLYTYSEDADTSSDPDKRCTDVSTEAVISSKCSTGQSAYVPVENSNKSGSVFYLDGVRVYNPAGTSTSDSDDYSDIAEAYEKDDEADPVVLNISDAVFSSSGSFATLTDIYGNITDKSLYTSYGPNNELYLYSSESSDEEESSTDDENSSGAEASSDNGDESADEGSTEEADSTETTSDPTTVSFYILNWQDSYKIYLGMKSPSGSAAIVTVGSSEEITLSNSVDCYYDITDYLTSVTLKDSSGNTVSGKKVTVTVSSGLASLTNIKVIGASGYTIADSDSYTESSSDEGSDEGSTDVSEAGVLTFASIDAEWIVVADEEDDSSGNDASDDGSSGTDEDTDDSDDTDDLDNTTDTDDTTDTSGSDTSDSDTGDTDDTTDTSDSDTGDTDETTDTSDSDTGDTDDMTDTSDSGSGDTDDTTDTSDSGSGDTDDTTGTSDSGSGETDNTTDTSGSDTGDTGNTTGTSNTDPSDTGSSDTNVSDSSDSTKSGTTSTAAAAKKTQKITVKKASLKKTVKYRKMKKKKQTFKIKATAKGKLTYTKISGSKKITVSKNGKVTIKKGLKKGTYKVKIKIKAAKTNEYKKAVVTKTLKITVK